MSRMSFALAALLAWLACASACDSPIFSFEDDKIQGWAGGRPPAYNGSASQGIVFAETNHATDGQYSLRVAFDYNAGTTVDAVYFVENLNFDFSSYSTLNFDIWKSGQPFSLTLALSTGSSWTWFESRAYSINDGESYLSIDLKSSDWKSESSNWVNNVPVKDLNVVHRIAVVLLPTATGFNEAFLDNFRLCSGSTVSTGSTTSTSSSSSSITGTSVTTTGTSSTTGGPVPSGFVTVSGNIFKLGNCQYYIHGTNTYYVIYAGNTSVQHVFEDCVSMGLNVLRTWAYLDIGSKDGSVRRNIDGPKNGIYFQYWDTNSNAVAYNDGDTGLKRLDYVVYEAKKNGVRLILAFTNNWKDFGGVDQYCVWFQKNYHDNFYTDESIRQAYKNYAAHVINRVNVYTGVAYKNEPTILAWELMNEPRCGNGNFPTSGSCTTETVSSWVNEMSTYIHSIDPNHMISVGDEGFFKNSAYGSGWIYDGSTGDYHSYTSNPHISFGTAHLYPSGWGQSNDWGNTWIKQHVGDVQKPFLLEEFGITDKNARPSVYGGWLNTIENSPGAGFSYWMLASYQTSSIYPDYDGYTVYNDDSGGANTIRNATAFFKNKEKSCKPTNNRYSSTTGEHVGAGTSKMVITPLTV